MAQVLRRNLFFIVPFLFTAVLANSHPARAQEVPSSVPDTSSAVAEQQSELVEGAAGTNVGVAQAGTGESVKPNGALDYTIPIAVPPGVRGMQPKLSLVYNSMVPNGLVGMGWTLAGLPTIKRINMGTGINYDGADAYAVLSGGWGSPDDPNGRLIDIGTDPQPRQLRMNAPSHISGASQKQRCCCRVSALRYEH